MNNFNPNQPDSIIAIENSIAFTWDLDITEISHPEFDNPPFYCENCNEFFYKDQLKEWNEPIYNPDNHNEVITNTYLACPFCNGEIYNSKDFIF